MSLQDPPGGTGAGPAPPTEGGGCTRPRHQTRDDAAVYQLSPTEAIVETVDFFTPVVDDPYWFGRIAAANAFSDVWLMGVPHLRAQPGRLPGELLPMEVLADILRGGSEAAALAGAPVLGGHSIDDPEPKYGMAVTGLVHPDWNSLATSAPAGRPAPLRSPSAPAFSPPPSSAGRPPREQIAGVTAVMADEPGPPGRCSRRAGAVSALTDVTGFGLLWPRWRWPRARRSCCTSTTARVPVQPGALLLAEQDVVPGGSKANLKWVSPHVRFDGVVAPPAAHRARHAQTNGGLLAAVHPDRFPAVMRLLADRGRRGRPCRGGPCRTGRRRPWSPTVTLRDYRPRHSPRRRAPPAAPTAPCSAPKAPAPKAPKAPARATAPPAPPPT